MPSSLVVDASALVDSLLHQHSSPWSDASALHSPTLVDYEVLHVLRRASRHPSISASAAREALESYLELQIERHPAAPLLRAMWLHRHNFSAYDASYVALAQALGVPLLTSDLRMARAADRWCEVITPG